MCRTRFTLTIFAAAILPLTVVASAENIDPYNDGSQYAYGENVGWLNFEPSKGPGVTVSKMQLTGYVWAENIGWVNLDPNFGGIINDGYGNLSGYAWAENVGWVNFNPNVPGDPNHYGVTIDTDGDFDGWAWGENIGWIHFQSTSPIAYKVKVCKVSFEDLLNFVDDWLKVGPALPADLNNNDEVDFVDYSIFADYWRDYCPDDWLLKPDAYLVAHWKLDGDATDSSGNGNHGTLAGNPSWVTGRVGGALSLDGNGDYVDCGNDPIFDITDQITLAVWVKTNDSGNNEHNPYVAKGDHSYAIKHRGWDNHIEFFIYDANWYAASFPVNSSFDGVWHHLVGTYDGNQIKLYLDGVLLGLLDHTGSIATSAFNVNIGRNSEVTNRFYNGVIDDVRIYNRALTDEEVKALFDSF